VQVGYEQCTIFTQYLAISLKLYMMGCCGMLYLVLVALCVKILLIICSACEECALVSANYVQIMHTILCYVVFMVAIWNRADHYVVILRFLLLSSFCFFLA